jgi:tryptophan 2,3-dioxygenase
MSLTYSRYLALEELLQLQRPLSEGPEHDEVLFIVIHQVYELWFKQILHELDRLGELLETGAAARAPHTLKRVLTILKVLVAQIDVLETMTPLEFLTFRDRLESSSGFESAQFRAIEFVLGMKRRSTMEHYPEGTADRELLEQRFRRTTLWDQFLHHLQRQGYAIPADQLNRDVTQPLEPSPGVQEVLIRVYRTDPAAAELCERLVDLDEGLQEWRYRHVKMVQRTIGVKMGTGGSAGAEYLARTLMKPAFPDLWEIRSRL